MPDTFARQYADLSRRMSELDDQLVASATAVGRLALAHGGPDADGVRRQAEPDDETRRQARAREIVGAMPYVSGGLFAGLEGGASSALVEEHRLREAARVRPPRPGHHAELVERTRESVRTNPSVRQAEWLEAERAEVDRAYAARWSR